MLINLMPNLSKVFVTQSYTEVIQSLSTTYIRNCLFTGLGFVQTCSNLSVLDGESASFLYFYSCTLEAQKTRQSLQFWREIGDFAAKKLLPETCGGTRRSSCQKRFLKHIFLASMRWKQQRSDLARLCIECLFYLESLFKSDLISVQICRNI